MTARPATIIAAMIPPFAPAESPPPDEYVVLEFAVELEVGAPRHANDPVMPSGPNRPADFRGLAGQAGRVGRCGAY
jgi:hypothetical protein